MHAQHPDGLEEIARAHPAWLVSGSAGVIRARRARRLSEPWFKRGDGRHNFLRARTAEELAARIEEQERLDATGNSEAP